MRAVAYYQGQNRVTDRTILNLLALLVHDRLTHMPDSLERNAIGEAWAAVLSAVERPIVGPPGAAPKNDWLKEIEQTLKSNERHAPDMDDPEYRKKAWDNAEAAGLGWPGDFSTASGDGR